MAPWSSRRRLQACLPSRLMSSSRAAVSPPSRRSRRCARSPARGSASPCSARWTSSCRAPHPSPPRSASGPRTRSRSTAVQRHARFDAASRQARPRRARRPRGDRRCRRADRVRHAAGGRRRTRAAGRAGRDHVHRPGDAAAVARALERQLAARVRAAVRLRLVAARSTSWRSWPRPSCATPAPSPRSPSSRPSRSRCGCSAREAGRAISGAAGERGIALRTGAQAIAARDGRARARRRRPRARGPRDRAAAPGRPGHRRGCRTRRGFIPVDAHGRVPGVPDVFAAGDATTFPLKQGGLATPAGRCGRRVDRRRVRRAGRARSRSGR